MSDPIRNLVFADLPELLKLANKEIGKNYYSLKELEKIFENSIKNNVNCSFVLVLNGQLKGFRLSYPPGKWQHGKGRQLAKDLWPHPLSETAYFQSLFLSVSEQGKGWGKTLSFESIKKLVGLNTKGIVCHSWLESPNNSSQKYLTRMGFQELRQYPGYWKNVDYGCTLCGKPCECTAVEMYLDLKDFVWGD